MRKRRACGLVIGFILVAAVPGAWARDLDQLIPGLFGGNFRVASGLGINVVGTGGVDTGAGTLGGINASIGSFRGQVPVASASAGFTYQFDPALDLFVRTTESLGPLFAERTQTLGKGKFSASFAYTHVGFDTFQGTNLSGLRVVVPAGAQVLDQNPRGNSLPGIADDVISLALDLSIKLDTFAFFFSYGVTDRLDVGLALPLVRVEMSGNAAAKIVDVKSDSGGFGTLNNLQFDPNSPFTSPSDPARKTATDSFDESSFGLGDIFLRAKYRLFESSWVDGAAAVTVTIPTGGDGDFRGFRDVTGTPVIILAKSFGFISPHLNAGYAFRSKKDVAQAVWAAGADLRILPWLTVAPDFLGFHDVDREGPIKDNVYQYSFGFKVNPWRQLVWGANFQFPLNREGLRADIIYTTQLEYTF